MSSGGGKGGGGSKKNVYYGTFAGELGEGPAHSIDYIILGGKLVWSGYQTKPADKDYVDLAVTNYGTIRFYFGTETQTPDPILCQYEDHPAYRGAVYVVFIDCKLDPEGGSNVPTAEFGWRAAPNQSIVTGTPTSGYDGYKTVNPIVASAEILTSWNWAEVSASEINTATFQTAANALQADVVSGTTRPKTAIAPLWNSQVELKAALADISTIANCFWRRGEDGKIEAHLWRRNGSTALTRQLDYKDVTSFKPKATQEPGELPNAFFVSYTDCTRHHKENGVEVNNLASIRNRGSRKCNNINRPFIIYEDQARMHGSDQLRENATPDVEMVLDVRRSRATNLDGSPLRPGDYITFPINEPNEPMDLRLWRVTRREFEPTGTVQIEVKLEKSGEFQVVPQTQIPTKVVPVMPPIASSRVFSIAPELNGEKQAIVALAARPYGMTYGFEISYCDTQAGDYALLGTQRTFATPMTVEQAITEGATSVRLKLRTGADGIDLKRDADYLKNWQGGEVEARNDDLVLVLLKKDAQGRIVTTANGVTPWVEIMSVAGGVSVVSADTFDIPVFRGRIGTTAKAFGADSAWATYEAWFLTKDGLLRVVHPDFDEKQAAGGGTVYFRLIPYGKPGTYNPADAWTEKQRRTAIASPLLEYSVQPDGSTVVPTIAYPLPATKLPSLEGAAIGSSAKLIRLQTNNPWFQVYGHPEWDGETGYYEWVEECVSGDITLTCSRQNMVGSVAWTVTPSITLSGSGDSRTISGDEFVASGYSAVTVRVTGDDGLFDEVTLRQVYVNRGSWKLSLTNEAVLIPTDAAGNNGDYSGAVSQLQMFYDGQAGTGLWTFSATPGPGVVGTWNSSNNTYTVTNMTVDSGYVEFSASRSGLGTQTIRMSLAKSKTGVPGATGADAVAYKISNAAPVKKSAAGIFTALIASAIRTIGSGSPATYSGWWKVESSPDGTTWTSRYTSASAESAISYTAGASSNYTHLRVSLYSTSGMTTLLDQLTVPVVFDGTAGADAQYVTVTGEQVFKYAAGASVPTNTSITLTAQLFGGLSTYDWEYWTGSDWANLSGTQNAATYALAYNNAAFTGNTLRVRCLSGAKFDEITISKVFDGTNGSNGTNGADAYTVVLTNEAQTVACDSSGTALAGQLGAGGLARTDVKVFKGATALTATTGTPTSGQFKIVLGSLTGCTATIEDADTVRLDTVTTNAGTAALTIQLEGTTTTVSKLFSFSKAIAGTNGANGADATVYKLAGVAPVKKTKAGVFTMLIASAVVTVGNGTPAAYIGRFKIETSTDGTNFSTASSSSAAEASRSFTPTTGSSITHLRASLYLAADSSMATVIDQITVPVVLDGSDGSNGTNGSNGNDAVIASLDNDATTVPADSSGNVISYAGAVSTCSIMKGATNDSANWTFAATLTNCSGTLSGTPANRTVTITGMTADVAYVDWTATRSGWPSQTKRFTITKAKAGSNGSNGSNGSDGVTPTVYLIKPNINVWVYGMGAVSINFWQQLNGVQSAYSGYYRIYSLSGSTWTLRTSGNGNSTSYTPLSTYDAVRIELFSDSGYTNKLDQTTISVVTNGSNGNDATAYSLWSTAAVLNKSIAGVFTPTSVTFTGYSKTGTSAPALYAGRFIIAESTDGSTFTDKYTSSINESSKAYTPSASTVKAIRCRQYLAGGTATQIGETLVTVATDGATGANGSNGANGANGARGSVSKAGSTANTSWVDADAVAVLSASGLTPQALDQVTLYNSSVGFSETRTFNGTSWVAVGKYLNGNIFLDGTIDALSLKAFTAWAKEFTIADGGFLRSGQTAFNTGNGFWFDSSGGVTRASLRSSNGDSFVFNGTSGIAINASSLNIGRWIMTKAANYWSSSDTLAITTPTLSTGYQPVVVGEQVVDTQYIDQSYGKTVLQGYENSFSIVKYMEASLSPWYMLWKSANTAAGLVSAGQSGFFASSSALDVYVNGTSVKRASLTETLFSFLVDTTVQSFGIKPSGATWRVKEKAKRKGSLVVMLNGGTSQDCNLDLTGWGFAEKPNYGIIQIQGWGNVHAYYNFDSAASTTTNAVFTFTAVSGTLPNGAVRCFYEVCVDQDVSG